MEFQIEVAVVMLTDRRGRILMQHRTDDAPCDPGLWTVPGGGIEPGESPIEAAHRELFEETGLRCPDLTFDRTVIQTFDDEPPLRYHVFTATTDASDDDVVLGEGQAMIFLTPEEIWSRDVVPVAQTFLPRRPNN